MSASGILSPELVPYVLLKSLYSGTPWGSTGVVQSSSPWLGKFLCCLMFHFLPIWLHTCQAHHSLLPDLGTDPSVFPKNISYRTLTRVRWKHPMAK